MFMLINSGVRNAYIILFMYLFSFFPYWREQKNAEAVFCTPRFGGKINQIGAPVYFIPKSQDST